VMGGAQGMEPHGPRAWPVRVARLRAACAEEGAQTSRTET